MANSRNQQKFKESPVVPRPLIFYDHFLFEFATILNIFIVFFEIFVSFVFGTIFNFKQTQEQQKTAIHTKSNHISDAV